MKYSTEVIIDLPREEVIKKLDNPDNMKHWQRGFIEYEQLDGSPGQEGAKMRLDYKMGKRELSMTETITKNSFPEEFHANYDTKGVQNIQKNYFHELEGNKTKWLSENEFKFDGFGMKLMGWLMPGAFKKQSLKYLNDFKNFAENNISVTDEGK